MDIPLGYAQQGDSRVKKSLNDLRQTFRQGFSKLSIAIICYGLNQANFDHSLFIKSIDGHFIVLLIYVDDIIFASNDQNFNYEFKIYVDNKFKKDLENLKYFLDLEVLLYHLKVLLYVKKITLQKYCKTWVSWQQKQFIFQRKRNAKFSSTDGDILIKRFFQPLQALCQTYLTISRLNLAYAV